MLVMAFCFVLWRERERTQFVLANHEARLNSLEMQQRPQVSDADPSSTPIKWKDHFAKLAFALVTLFIPHFIHMVFPHIKF